MAAGTIRWGTPGARWVVLATVLGSGIAFLDGTIVNVALPAISRDLDTDLAGLQWVVNGYLVTLTAGMLLGGALGDRYGRRRLFLAGLALFSAASLTCAVAPTIELLIAARVVQGLGGALLVPGSLALLSAAMHPDDRGAAVGAWSGLAGVASALGPFVGGWLIDAASWRFAFALNLPLAAGVVVAARHVPESRDDDAPRRLDYLGAGLVAVALSLLTRALIESGQGWTGALAASAVIGLGALIAFLVVEHRSPTPMLPLRIFRSMQFTGANLTTFVVYGGLSGAMFFVVLHLQIDLGYSAIEAGSSLLPVTLLMLALSARVGAVAQRTGPRLPMTVGPLVAAGGLLLLSGIDPGDGYLAAVLPGAVVFGLGLAITVAPLTAAVLAAAEERHLGVASATNNAVARLAGLLAVAVLPGLAGIDPSGTDLTRGYGTALTVCAALCVLGGGIAALTIRTTAPVEATIQASILQPCHDPCRAESEHAA